VSTAKRYIYAGLVLLAAAFLAATAASATYVEVSHGSLTLSLGGGARLYPAVSLAVKAVPGLSPVEAKNLTLVVSCIKCPGSVRVEVLHGAEKAAALTLHDGETGVLHANGLDAVLLEADKPSTLRIDIEARYPRRPLLWLSVPALAAALAGTGILSAGAVLRLSGLEEPEGEQR